MITFNDFIENETNIYKYINGIEPTYFYLSFIFFEHYNNTNNLIEHEYISTVIDITNHFFSISDTNNNDIIIYSLNIIWNSLAYNEKIKILNLQLETLHNM
jgi:hypothetical protein